MRNRYKLILLGISVVSLVAAVGYIGVEFIRLRKEVAAVKSTYLQVEATLAEKVEELSMSEAQLAEVSDTGDRQQQRISDLQGAIRTALSNIPPLASTSCLRDDRILTGNHLGLRIDSKSKTIDHADLAKFVEHEGAWTVRGVYFDTKSLPDDANVLSKIVVKTEDGVTEISNGPETTARAFDFIALLGGPEGNQCHIPLRLHFARAAEQIGDTNWSIVNVIGRSGLGIGRFSLPYGTQFHDGHLWTTDCSNENVSVFSLDGQFKGSFGEFGTRLGKLDTPAALAIVGEKIYVTEERNHRIQVFDMDGASRDIIGSYKATDDPMMYTNKLNAPLGIAWSGETLAVVDYGNNRIVGINPGEGYKAEWVSGNVSLDEEISWKGPYYIRWSTKGGYYVVSNRGANELVLIGPKGEKIRSIGRDFLDYPHEVDVDEHGNIYVADMNNHRVVIFSAADDFSQETAQVINFPEPYGLPKTLTVLPDSQISVGFVGNGSAYFLVLASNAIETGAEVTALAPPASESSIQFSGSATQQPVGEQSSLEVQAREVYSNFCSACHENGDYDAPARGNIEAWERFPKDLDALLSMAATGKGAMVPRGGCDDCSDELLKEVIKLMVPMTWYQSGFLQAEN